MEQLTLFQLTWGTVPPPPHSGSETSREAAEQITTTAGRLRQRVLKFIVDRGDAGATDSEIQAALAMEGNTERPRRRELIQACLIRNSGRTRPTPAGRQATVWVAMGE